MRYMYTKKILTTLLLFMALSAAAIPPITDFLPIRQSDGTTLMVRRYGTWRTAFYATRDGQVVVRSAATGDLCYARLADGKLESTGIRAHEMPDRTADEKEWIAGEGVSVQQAAATIKPLNVRKNAPIHSIGASTDDGLGKYGQSGIGAVPSIGDVVIPVIMTEFSDTKFRETTTIEKMDRFYNEPGYSDEKGCVGSVRDYFIAQSGGMFRPRFVVVAKVTLTKTAADYGNNDNPRGYYEVVQDAMNAAAKTGVNWNSYVQGKGIPLVSVLYAGEGEATGGGEDTLWPCEADVHSTMSNVLVKSIFIGNEIFHDGTLMGMGVFCHEFGHALGLPDFYCTDYNHNAVTMGQWSVMCSGCYLPDNHARAPIGYTAYERSYLGWQDIPDLNGADVVTLYPFGSDKGSNAVLLRNDDDEREYFILEQRQPGTWYNKRFGNGLFVTHVTYDSNSWYYNTLNNSREKLRMTYLPATSAKEGGSAAELFPGTNGNKTSLTRYSSPPLKLFDGHLLDKPVYKIKIEDDKSVSFNYLQEEISVHQPGELMELDGITYRFTTRSTVDIAPKEGGYSGTVSVPASFADEIHTYNVTGVAEDAFANCPQLTKVSLPASIKSVAGGAFANSPKLKEIAVASDNKHFLSLGGALFSNSLMVTDPVEASKEVEGETNFDFKANPWQLDAATNRLKFDAGVISKDIIADDITLTCNAADAMGKTLVYMLKTGDNNFEFVVRKGASITFSAPDNVRMTRLDFTSPALGLATDEGTLDGTTWRGNTHSLTFTATANTRITFATVKTNTHPDYSAAVLYSYPAGISATAYNVPVGISSIAARAFAGTRLTTLTLSDSLQTLGADAIAIPSLTRLKAKTAVPAVCEANPFTGIVFGNCRLEVPTGSEAAYRAAPYWQHFYGIDAITTPQVTLGSDVPAYDLQGRRTNKAQRGVYIVGGRKVVR